MPLRFFRKIENKRRRDRIRNMTIRNHLKITPVILEERLASHIQRMDDNRLTKRIYDDKVQDKNSSR